MSLKGGDIMNIGDRIKELRISSQMSQQELADKLNVAKQTVYKYENGIVTNIPSDKIEIMASLFHVPPQSIMGWDDSPSSPSDLEELYEKYPNIKPIKKVKIPMLGKIACGEPTFADEEHEAYIETDGHINADFCLTCAGDSMEPKLMNGDIVFIRKQPEVNDGQIAAVLIEDEATLKRVYYDKANNILQLIAENPKYKPLVYSGPELDQIHILGLAVSLYRRMK